MGSSEIKSVVISGAGGFVGSHISSHFEAMGATVKPLLREYFTDEGGRLLDNAVNGSDMVVNLAGATINRRWTDKYKRELYQSRIETTRRLRDSIVRADRKPRVFFSASAAGYYADHGCNSELQYTEGSGFLASLCRAWESEAVKARDSVRTVVMRFGLVLASDGGVMEAFRLPARLGVAPILGSGRQYFPWIDIRDLIRAVGFIASNEELEGAFNFVAPEAVSNRRFTEELSEAKGSKLLVKIPSWVIKTLYGEASSFLLSGQCVVPEKLTRAGFTFESPDIGTFFSRQGR